MDKTKRKRLEKKGWRVGTVDEFLDLSPEESAYIEVKLKLSESLRKRRKGRKLTQSQFARLVKSSQSRIAKMEAGDPTVSMDLLVRTLLRLGASTAAVAELLEDPRRWGAAV